MPEGGPVGAAAPVGSSAALTPLETPAAFVGGDRRRERRPCNGGTMSNVCGEGKGTAWGVAGASLTIGVSGATDDFGRGVTAVGDRDAIAGRAAARGPDTTKRKKKTRETVERPEQTAHVGKGNSLVSRGKLGNCLGKSRGSRTRTGGRGKSEKKTLKKGVEGDVGAERKQNKSQSVTESQSVCPSPSSITITVTTLVLPLIVFTGQPFRAPPINSPPSPSSILILFYLSSSFLHLFFPTHSFALLVFHPHFW